MGTKDGPAETVNHAHHGIQAVPEPPFFRNNGAHKSDRTDVHAHADDEWDDMLHVAIFHVQRAQPETHPKGREHGDKKE